MVKHTQTIRWEFADEVFECVWPFCGAFKGLMPNFMLFIFCQLNFVVRYTFVNPKMFFNNTFVQKTADIFAC